MYINTLKNYKTNLLGSTLAWPEQVTVVLNDFGTDCTDLLTMCFSVHLQLVPHIPHHWALG